MKISDEFTVSVPVAVAVIENPYAGKYVEDLSELMAIGEELGELLTLRVVAALGIAANSV